MPYRELGQESTGRAANQALPALRSGGARTTSRRSLPSHVLRALIARAQNAIRRRPSTTPPRTDTDPLQLDPVDLATIRDWDDSVCELPVDEEVRLRSIWITEAYPPSSVPVLMESLARLGWDVPNRYGANGLSPEKLRDARTGRGLSFCRLGTMTVAGELNELLGYRTVELPEGFERVHVTADHSVPSITILTFQFILTYEASRELTELFQREDPALKDDLGAWMRRTGPMRSEMKAVVAAVRERQRRACAEWVSSRVPGLFTAWGGVAAAEFITLEKGEPLKRDGAYTEGYIQALGLHRSFYASELWGRQGLRLEWPFLYGSVGNLLFGGRMSELYDLENPDGSDSFMERVAEHARDALVLWALYETVRRSTEQIAVLRDRVAGVAAVDAATAVRELGAVQREFMRLVVDTVPMEREVREFCEDTTRYHQGNSGEFSLIDLYGSTPEGKDHVFEYVRKKTLEEAERLGRTSADLRAMMTTTSSILNSLAQERATEENLRLQRRVYGMTIVFGVLAAVLSILQIAG
jgi:hypothetical protein